MKTNHPVTLELEPTSAPYQYTASLSGPIETSRGWSELHHHPLNCIMRFSSFIID